MRLVAGRYAVLGELGRGGMGVVWRAEDRVLGRQVALKELQTPPGTTPAQIERVMREARTAGRLNDPAVVTVYDVVAEPKATYIVMELVSAPTLDDLLERGGALPGSRVSELGLRILGALETAHAAGIVHRDVKPSNIMVLPGDRVKLADFGIARAMDDPGLTQSGGVMGSPGYMAPELFAGARPTPASDLWSLGATLYHAAEGRAPFERETTAAVLHAIMYETPVLEHTTGALAAVIRGLLAQAPEERIDARRVRDLLTGKAVIPVEPPTVYIEPVKAAEAKPRRRFALAGIAVAVVAALAAIYLLRPDNEKQAIAAPEPTTEAVTTQTTVPSKAKANASSTEAAESTEDSAPPSGAAGPAGENPSEAPSPSASSAAQPERKLVPLTRYRAERGHSTASRKVQAPKGFSADGALGAVVAKAEPGTAKLFACKANNDDDWFTAIGGCAGQETLGQLGFIFTAPPATGTAQPLYRCNAGNDHFDSLSAGCEGKAQETMLGYVLISA
ncbi:serine/threonine-protein kinase [Amycolatopsis sp. NPDC059657]|uniref:serine/threonine-protein kinase n=1 Tax=Amycolatopsis sp. NPDC059657 TaxID=3346899 RepID=UPI00366B7AB0